MYVPCGFLIAEKAQSDCYGIRTHVLLCAGACEITWAQVDGGSIESGLSDATSIALASVVAMHFE
eukprot:4084629-Pyramimonas_sp.AAC.1